MRLVIDIEADDLLQGATRAWIIGCENLDTGEVKWWLDGDLGWQEYFNKCTVAIGHNFVGYDDPLLYKLFKYKLPSHVKKHDTMLLSLVVNYNRFPQGRHSLENWGEYLNCPKGKFSDFSKYSEEMLVYWKQDIELTKRVYQTVITDFNKLKEKSNKIVSYMRAETAVAEWCAMAELEGWPFDVTTARALLERMEIEQQVCRDKLLPRLGTKTVAPDKKNGEVKAIVPKWTKSGAYHMHLANWFGIMEESGQDEDRLIEGPFCKVEFVDLDVNSVSDMKIFLFRHGWVPTEYNTKTEPDPDKPGKFLKTQTSPKITEDSLECMEGDGKLYCDFLATSSRVGILKGWLENVDSNGRLHGQCFTIGTPSMRARHSIIVNIPSANAPWGKEMRSLFICDPGWSLIGSDSSGNQARGLAHYLGSPEYVDLLLHGDIHQFNADCLTKVLADMGIIHTVSRASAKRVLYAFLFGASGGKLWSYIFGNLDDVQGKKLKAGFTKAVPGFKDLVTKLERIFGRTKQYGDGYIPGIAGNRIYCDSFHKLLVYLLQACEKATCSAAVMLTMKNLEAANIPYKPLIMYHDEIDYMVPDEYAEQAAAISKQAFKEGPELFDITIMDGESKIGRSWYDVH